MHKGFNIELNNDIDMQEASRLLRESAAAHKESATSMRKTFLSTGVVMLSLVALLIAVYAWFVNLDEVEGTGIALNTTATQPEIGDIEVYNMEYRNLTSKSGDGNLSIQLYNDKSGQQNGSLDSLTMNIYDAIEMYANKKVSGSIKYSTIGYIKVPVTYDKFEDIRSIDVTLSRDSSSKWTTYSSTSSSNKAYLSSFIYFRASLVPSIDEDLDSSSNTYEYKYSQISNNITSTKKDDYGDNIGNYSVKQYFKKYSSSTYSKTKTVSLSIEDRQQAKEVYGERDKANIYILVDYYPEAIKKYLGDNTADAIKNGVTIVNDLKNIKVNLN